MRSQPIGKPDKPKKQTVVISDKRPKVKPPPKVAPGETLRTIHYVEVNDMQPQKIQFFVQELNATYNPAEQGIHFVIPIRDGKIGSDIVFEEEFLKVVDETCEVVDAEGNIIEGAQIRLQGGAKDVTIVRERF